MAKSNQDQEMTIVDGSLDFSGGVNSYVVPTVQSASNPNGLKRNQLAWMNNCTVRGGGITQRTGWKSQGALPSGAVGLYQGKFMYEPDSEVPYEIMAVGGHIWKVDVDNPSAAVDLSAQFGITFPADIPRYYFAQAEQFLIIQAGDFTSLPLFWDGSTLRKSVGLSGNGLVIPKTNIGYLVTQQNNPAWVVPAIGANSIALNCFDSAAPYGSWNIGDFVYVLQGVSYDPITFQIVNFASVLAQFQIVAPSAHGSPSSITLKTGWGVGPFSPGTNIGGVTNLFHLTSPPVSAPGTPEIPPASAMDYFMGRLWYAQGRQYSAGDIVGGSSGTAAYNFRDAVLKVTENPLAIGGDGFTVPTNAGNIRAIKHSANINTQLGQGQLYIFTRKSVYSLSVPVSRQDWIVAGNAAGATGANQMPLQTVVQVTNGAVNDRSVAAQNGDLFFQSFEPSIRSLMICVRNFTQWGNVPISINEARVLRFNDRSLMQFASGISFDNRMLQTALPELTPVGAASRAIIPLNFDVVSTLETQLPPVWEGMYEGLSVLELDTGDFGGRPRAFATVWSDRTKGLELWELTDSAQFENGDNRIAWFFETPAFTWGNEFELKKLVSAELWIDRIYGEVMYSMQYRPDSTSCWYNWHQWKLCTARNSCEDVDNPQCLYPQTYGESFRQTITLPTPTPVCQKESGRPSNIGFQFQFRLNIKGFCRIRGLLFKAETRDQELFGDMVC